MTGALLGARLVRPRASIPPAPLAMPETAVGHGTLGQLRVPAGEQARDPRATSSTACAAARCCASPAASRSRSCTCGRTAARSVVRRSSPSSSQCDDGDGDRVSQRLPAGASCRRIRPGTWACATYTVGGQLVGVRKFEVLTAKDSGEPIDGAGEPADAGLGASGRARSTGRRRRRSTASGWRRGDSDPERRGSPRARTSRASDEVVEAERWRRGRGNFCGVYCRPRADASCVDAAVAARRRGSSTKSSSSMPTRPMSARFGLLLVDAEAREPQRAARLRRCCSSSIARPCALSSS